MKKITMLICVVALGACARGDDVTAPDAQRPSFHVVVTGKPDGAYSMSFTGTDGTSTLNISLTQEWDVATTTTMCEPNQGAHDDHSGDPILAEALDDMGPARGSGFFVSGRQGGILTVTEACWFDEWNAEGGFPESAWVRGTATVGLRRRAFAARLTSNGWPELTHLFQLDVAELYLDRHRKGLTESDGLFTVFGELHHEDGTSLVP
jgi:hypothetical protein